MSLKNRLGWNQTPEDWKRFLRISPKGCFKALSGGRLIGTAIVFVSESVAWIAAVMVEESRWGQGVGKALMQRCLQQAREAGACQIRLDATAAGLPLYRWLGFKEHYGVGAVKGRAQPSPAIKSILGGMDRGLCIRSVTEADLDPLLSLDASAIGARRPALLQAYLADNPGWGAVVYRNPEKLCGYLLYRSGSHSLQLGPLIAVGKEEAFLLMHTVFEQIDAKHPGATICLTVPLNNPEMAELLGHWGLSCTPRLTRMTLGEKPKEAREELVFALSGPELG